MKVFIWISVAVAAIRVIWGLWELTQPDKEFPVLAKANWRWLLVGVVGRAAWLTFGLTLLREMYR